MKILVIIVTYNAMQWVERCFDSLKKSIAKLDVFVVDNGSTDGTQAYIKGHYPEVMFQQSDKNLGFGKANNLGLQYALDNAYDFVYLLNQDAWVFPKTISSLIEISQKHSDYGVLSPFQMSADEFCIDPNFSSRLKTWGCYAEMTNDMYNGCLKDVYDVEGVMAAHWFVTRKCLETVGGFSPTFPHYGEDDNYTERVRYKGLKIGVVPKLKVVHDRMLRKDDNAKKIYKNYMKSLVYLSSPYKSTKQTLLYLLRKSVNTSWKYKTIKPFANFCKVIGDLNVIKKNKHITMVKECAFLN